MKKHEETTHITRRFSTNSPNNLLILALPGFPKPHGPGATAAVPTWQKCQSIGKWNICTSNVNILSRIHCKCVSIPYRFDAVVLSVGGVCVYVCHSLAILSLYWVYCSGYSSPISCFSSKLYLTTSTYSDETWRKPRQHPSVHFCGSMQGLDMFGPNTNPNIQNKEPSWVPLS